MMKAEQLADWWRERVPRERHTLTAGALILMLVLMYLLIEPVLTQRARIESELPLLRDDLAWMQSQLAEIDRLRGKPVTPANATAPLSVSLVEDMLRSSGIHDRLSDLRPVQQASVALRFERVGFAELMQFLLRLREQTAATVTLASIQALSDEPGLVECSLTIGPAASR